MPKFCTTCGKPLQFEDAEICPGCGVRIKAPPPPPAKSRSAGIAVLLSFLFVGWGHWYNGRTRDGLKFFGAFLGSWIVMIVLALLMPTQPSAAVPVLLLLVLSVGIWIYGMYDAYKTTARINRGELEFSKKSGLFWLPVVLIILAVLLVSVIVVIAAFVFGTSPGVQPGTPHVYPGVIPYYTPPRTVPIPTYYPVHIPTVPAIPPVNVPNIVPVNPIPPVPPAVPFRQF